MTTLLTVARMLRRRGSRAERSRSRLMATGAALATVFLLAALNVLILHGRLDERLGPVGDPGTRDGTAFALALMLLPVAAFLHQSGRLATADRERRLSALRLAGATPREVRLLGAIEMTGTAVLGTVAGAAGYLLVQWAARRLLLDPGSGLDVNVPPLPALVAMATVVGTAAVSGLLAGRHVVTSPLSVTRRANRRPPHWYGLVLIVLPSVVMYAGWLAEAAGLPYLRSISAGLILGGGAATLIGLLHSASRLIWSFARMTGHRARSAETLIAARALESDPRAWGRTLSVVGLAVAIGTGTGWIEAEIMATRDGLEPFWLTSFVLVDLATLVGMVVAAAALRVHQAEYLLEQGPLLANLRAIGTSERELRRVLTRQALIASAPVCVIAALTGLIAMGRASRMNTAWAVLPVAQALFMAGAGMLAAVTVAAASRRRLRRAIAPERLRTE